MTTVGIIGASGYTGGELLRLLLPRDDIEIVQATSRRYMGEPLVMVHPNLRGIAGELRFSSDEKVEKCDVLFTCLPHGSTMTRMDDLMTSADHVVDLSADFRLQDPDLYSKWYGTPHSAARLLPKFAYGLPELHRDDIKELGNASGVGCVATSVNLPLYPFREFAEKVVADVKIGSSAAGNSPSDSSHHPERKGVIRPYAPAGHRHQAEVIQECGMDVMLTAHAVEMVRGISTTLHLQLKRPLEEKECWSILRKCYGDEPFIRIVKSKKGLYRYPEPKILEGTNYCDIGFELDRDHNRLVLFCAIDNLVKGAAGSAVQCMNIMLGLPETKGLEFPGLHPA